MKKSKFSETQIVAILKQGDGGALFLIQVKPSVGYFYIDFGVFIHALNTEGKCVDTTGDLGVAASLCGNIADLVAFGFQAGCNAGEITSLIDAAEIIVEVFTIILVAGAVQELDLGKLLGHFDHRIHVAKAGANNQTVALRGQVAHYALGICAFGHFVHNAGLDFVAKLGFERLTCGVVREGPACITHRVDINKRDFQRLFACGTGCC